MLALHILKNEILPKSEFRIFFQFHVFKFVFQQTDILSKVKFSGRIIFEIITHKIILRS